MHKVAILFLSASAGLVALANTSVRWEVVSKSGKTAVAILGDYISVGGKTPSPVSPRVKELRKPIARKSYAKASAITSPSAEATRKQNP